MVDVGLIRGYSTMLDAEMLGQVSVVLLVESKPADLDKVVEKIKDQELVRQIYVLSDSRVMCILSFYNQIKYQRFLESLASVPEITRMDNSMVMRVPKESPRAALTDEAGLLIRCYYCSQLHFTPSSNHPEAKGESSYLILGAYWPSFRQLP